MKPMPPLEDVAKLLACDLQTGDVTWKVKRNSRAGCVKPGHPAGWDTDDGYRTVTVMQRDIKLHRLVWAFANGRWPEGRIDHVNGNRTDNRPDNLRIASATHNSQNHHGLRPDNTSGVKGVYRDRRRGTWCAQIHVNGKHRYLGSFSRIEDAAAAYREGRRTHHPHAHEASMIAENSAFLEGTES